MNQNKTNKGGTTKKNHNSTKPCTVQPLDVFCLMGGRKGQTQRRTMQTPTRCGCVFSCSTRHALILTSLYEAGLVATAAVVAGGNVESDIMMLA